jgi:ferredoxin
MRARFEVEEDECIGCGLCEERAPENIQTPAGDCTAQVVKQPLNDAEEEACKEAAEYCPMGGLHIVNSDAIVASPTPDQRRDS